MRLLAIDTSTRRAGVAVADGAEVLGEVALGSAAGPARPRHAEQLAPAIDFVTREVGVGLDGLDAIAVVVGPGMFTGLRVGVTTAKTLAQALGVRVIGVPSLDVVARPLRHAERLVVAAIDARRHQVYYALYRPAPGGMERLSDDEIGGPDDVAAAIRTRGERAVVVGDGTRVCAEALVRLERVEVAGPGHAGPDLGALVELAAERGARGEVCDPADVRPVYLRRSDAEIARDERRRGGGDGRRRWW